MLRPVCTRIVGGAKATANAIHTRALVPGWDAACACTRFVRDCAWACPRYCFEQMKELATPGLALVTGYTFAKNGAARLANDDDTFGWVLLLAAVPQIAAGLVMAGHVCRNMAARQRRSAIRCDGLHPTQRSVAGTAHTMMGKLLETIAAVDRVGVFAYLHADLGLVDFLSWATVKVSPVAARALDILASLISGVWSLLKTIVVYVTNGVWKVAKLLASEVKTVLSTIFSAIGDMIWKIWSNPALGLITSGLVFFTAYHVHNNYPDFNFRNELSSRSRDVMSALASVGYTQSVGLLPSTEPLKAMIADFTTSHPGAREFSSVAYAMTMDGFKGATNFQAEPVNSTPKACQRCLGAVNRAVELLPGPLPSERA